VGNQHRGNYYFNIRKRITLPTQTLMAAKVLELSKSRGVVTVINKYINRERK
jgi:hypothetical protein